MRFTATLWGWLAPRDTLAAARSKWARCAPLVARQLDAARTARWLARVSLPANDGPGGGRRAIADLLYAEAARNCLCILFECPTPSEVEQAITKSTAEHVAERVGAEEIVAALPHLLRASALQSGTPLPAAGRFEFSPRSVSDLLMRQVTRRRREYHRVAISVALRWLAVAAGIALFVTAITSLGSWHQKDLIAGATWRASSVESSRSTLTGRIPADIKEPFFFHTALEDSPWIEIELPAADTKVSQVEITNRTDCCRARALPMVVELSTDHSTWKVVARQPKVFDHWSARFAAQPARWLRLRVLRNSYLHLKGVAAY